MYWDLRAKEITILKDLYTRLVVLTCPKYTYLLHSVCVLGNNLLQLQWPLLCISTLHPFPRLLQMSFIFESYSSKCLCFPQKIYFKFILVLISLSYYWLTVLNLPQGCSWKCERLLCPSRALHRDDSKEAQAAQALINADWSLRVLQIICTTAKLCVRPSVCE
jgi:hypothetical protein